jgi:hypothetical protein
MVIEPIKLRLDNVKKLIDSLPPLKDIESMGMALNILEKALKELQVIRYWMSFQQQFCTRKEKEKGFFCKKR